MLFNHFRRYLSFTYTLLFFVLACHCSASGQVTATQDARVRSIARFCLMQVIPAGRLSRLDFSVLTGGCSSFGKTDMEIALFHTGDKPFTRNSVKDYLRDIGPKIAAQAQKKLIREFPGMDVLSISLQNDDLAEAERITFYFINGVILYNQSGRFVEITKSLAAPGALVSPALEPFKEFEDSIKRSFERNFPAFPGKLFVKQCNEFCSGTSAAKLSVYFDSDQPKDSLEMKVLLWVVSSVCNSILGAQRQCDRLSYVQHAYSGITTKLDLYLNGTTTFASTPHLVVGCCGMEIDLHKLLEPEPYKIPLHVAGKSHS